MSSSGNIIGTADENCSFNITKNRILVNPRSEWTKNIVHLLPLIILNLSKKNKYQTKKGISSDDSINTKNLVSVCCESSVSFGNVKKIKLLITKFNSADSTIKIGSVSTSLIRSKTGNGINGSAATGIIPVAAGFGSNFNFTIVIMGTLFKKK